MITSSNGNIFPRNWPFVRGIHRWFVNSLHKGQCGALMSFFHLCLNTRLSKQSWGWWCETPSRSLWYHCNGMCLSSSSYRNLGCVECRWGSGIQKIRLKSVSINFNSNLVKYPPIHSYPLIISNHSGALGAEMDIAVSYDYEVLRGWFLLLKYPLANTSSTWQCIIVYLWSGPYFTRKLQWSPHTAHEYFIDNKNVLTRVATLANTLTCFI